MFRYLQGRTNRATFWGSVLAAASVFAIIRVLDPKATIPEFVILVLCVPRLHDIGRSGWWVGGALVGELVILAAAFSASLSTMETVAGAYVLLLALLMVVLGCIPGQAVENRFGSPPRPALQWKPRPKPVSDEQG